VRPGDFTDVASIHPQYLCCHYFELNITVAVIQTSKITLFKRLLDYLSAVCAACCVYADSPEPPEYSRIA
jgi:hypothetical protein